MKKQLQGMLPARLLRIGQTLISKRPHRSTAMLYNSSSVLQCRIGYNKYGGYCVPLISSHRPAAQRILSGDVWEPNTIGYITSHCGDGDIVHAGTYFGDFLPALSHACASNSRIWAFEPNFENHRCAQITMLLNGIRNVSLTNAGLAEKEESLIMVTEDSNGRALGGASRISEQSSNDITQDTETVHVVALDEVVPEDRKVSIIQLDVEGFEKQALSGALNTIQRCLPIIILETVPDEDWLEVNILNLGYRAVKKVHENTIFMRD